MASLGAPRMEQLNLYNEFRLDVAWGQPGNKQVTSNTAPWLRCASDSTLGVPITELRGDHRPRHGVRRREVSRLSAITRPSTRPSWSSRSLTRLSLGRATDLSIERMNFAINVDRRAFPAITGRKGGARSVLRRARGVLAQRHIAGEKLRGMWPDPRRLMCSAAKSKESGTGRESPGSLRESSKTLRCRWSVRPRRRLRERRVDASCLA